MRIRRIGAMNHTVLCRVTCALGVVTCIQFADSLHAKPPTASIADTTPVGHVGANRYVTPTGQLLTPVGRQVYLPGFRPQALALSPDKKLLVTSGKTNFL